MNYNSPSMSHFYQQQQQQQHSPLLPRRATEPVTLAPTASMIDPNLENLRMQPAHLPRGYSRLQVQSQMQNQMASAVPMPPQNSGFQQTQPSHGHHNSSSERMLPSNAVDDNTIDTAYVQFIMYCNPSIPADVDTTELRKGFRNPPRSDGKLFSPYTLYELISRLEAKDLKTWTQLVIELGVEPPDTEKKQSTQKVQQYAVRLKRWLHAFHVDAFFSYLNGKPTSYVTERPTTEESLAETTRDGIPPEEDMAVRALLPEWRPKRGRRKADDIEMENDANAPNKKIQTRSSSADFTSMFEEQYSAAASSAIPWSTNPQQADPWVAAQLALAPKTPGGGQSMVGSQAHPQGGQQMRWRFTNNETPSSPYPQSAVIPRNPFSENNSFEEPRSAHPSTTSKSPSRNRKRHGPAVSSAWPSTTSTASGKLRGRPPSNRSVQDGPFTTFPANPDLKESSSMGTTVQASSSPSRETTATPQQNTNFVQAPALGPAALQKPSKLQLQVPEHAGGPVRLATPPRVLINGESNRYAAQRHERRSSADFFNQIDELSEDDGVDDGEDEEGTVDWKRRAMTLKRKLLEKEEELKAMKRRVLDAVM